jgi:hypothetical protein
MIEAGRGIPRRRQTELAGMPLLAEQGAANTAENRIGAPLRPYHGHELLDDGGRGTHPGYRLVGRLEGLADLRGWRFGQKCFRLANSNILWASNSGFHKNAYCITIII